MRIALFVACYDDLLFPATGRAVVRVLERLGHTVDYRAQHGCCGQMHRDAGHQSEAARMMRHFLEVYRDAETICVPSSSCVEMIRNEFPLLAEELKDTATAAAAREMATRVFEFSELLIDRLGVTDVGACFPHAVTLHKSCRDLRALHLNAQAWHLLEHVQAIRLLELPAHQQCCGFGGAFSVINPDISAAILSEKVQNILSTGAEYCAGLDNSCLMHIGGALNRQRTGVGCLHVAEILARTAEGAIA